VVHATAPGDDRTTVRSVRIRVTRRPALPVERPVRVTARRRGDAIVVRWRTAAPARRQYFIVASGDSRTIAAVLGRGRTRFTASLRPREGADVRRVFVAALSADSGAERGVRVPVR
jgi:hypothetical protein